MKLSIGELNVKCADISKSLHFYKDTLGFCEVEREGDCVRLELSGRRLLLIPNLPDTPDGISFDFSTDSADQAKKTLNDAGYGTEDGEYDDWKFFSVKDPDGNQFEIIEG